MSVVKLALLANDETKVLVAKDAATSASLVLCDLLDDQQDDAPEENEDGECVIGESIPIPVCNGAILQLVVDYMTLRHNNPPRELERPLKENLFLVLDEKDINFIKPLNEDTVVSLCVTSGFLNYPALKDLTSARLAEWIKEKSVEEIRALFGVENDFSEEELAAFRKEHGHERV